MARSRPAADEPEPAPAPSVTLQLPPANMGGPPRSSPLFPSLGPGAAFKPAAVRVWRMEPNDGYLGQLSPDADEETLRGLFGGGFYEVRAVNSAGQMLSGGRNTLRVAGEPFTAAAAKANAAAVSASPAELARPNGADLVQVATLMDARADRARQEAEATEARRRAEHERAMQLEQQRQDAKEAAEQRRHERAMELERLRAESSNNNTLNLVKALAPLVVPLLKSGGGSSELLQAIQVGAQLGSGNQAEPSVQVAQSFAQGLTALGGLARADAPRPAGPAALAAGAAPPKGAVPPAAANPAPAAPQTVAAPAVTNEAEKRRRIAQKLGAILEQMKAAGVDPEPVLDQVLSGDLVLAPAEDFEDETPENPHNGASPASEAQPLAGGRALGGDPHGG